MLGNDNLGDPLPAVTEDDIQDVERRWHVTFEDARRAILRSNESFDVQACPGSGKTTLLVAKLAVLAEKWPHSRRGVCVLSHTNAARREVETRLAGSAAGQRLLTHPHFVGTIHGFVNDFLALPVLRSDGCTVTLIDDEACFELIKRRLTSWPARGKLGNLAFKQRTLDGHIRSLVCPGSVDKLIAPTGVDGSLWNVLTGAKAAVIEKGFWYHADMFAAAEQLLSRYSRVAEFMRWRFPAVFIDEMQDTSEVQSQVLSRLFPLPVCALRQRFGDSNQAIYDFGQSRATTDPFPSPDFRTLPNSRRFGSQIARKAEPLAVDPPDPELKGEGPEQDLLPAILNPDEMPHTVFSFRPEMAQEVLPSFARLLLDTFPDPVLHSPAFVARAIGRVGKASEEEERELPRNLGDYWRPYEPRAARLEPRPQTLAGFLRLAQRKRGGTGDCAEAILTGAKGVIELIDKITPVNATEKARGMKYLRESLQGDEPALRALQGTLWQWCVELMCVSERSWLEQVAALRDALRPVIGEKWSPDAEEFCKWSAEFAGEPMNGAPTVLPAPNRYTFSEGGRAVDIDVGTIHGAKGQTHTATLVLETFFKKHDLTDLMPWLIGQDSKRKRGSEREDRTRLIYTAMTRPTHLLCLALRDEALGDGTNREATVDCLQSAGWQVTHL